jgi:hypothetical protein
MRTPPKRIFRKRPADPLGGNLGLAMFDLAEGGTTLLVSARVGTVRKLPAGYELGTCAECGHAVWVNARFVAQYRRNGKELRVECSGCAM